MNIKFDLASLRHYKFIKADEGALFGFVKKKKPARIDEMIREKAEPNKLYRINIYIEDF